MFNIYSLKAYSFEYTLINRRLRSLVTVVIPEPLKRTKREQHFHFPAAFLLTEKNFQEIKQDTDAVKPVCEFKDKILDIKKRLYIIY